MDLSCGVKSYSGIICYGIILLNTLDKSSIAILEDLDCMHGMTNSSLTKFVSC